MFRQAMIGPLNFRRPCPAASSGKTARADHWLLLALNGFARNSLLVFTSGSVLTVAGRDSAASSSFVRGAWFGSGIAAACRTDARWNCALLTEMTALAVNTPTIRQMIAMEIDCRRFIAQ
jgi:hypothetical protein